MIKKILCFFGLHVYRKYENCGYTTHYDGNVNTVDNIIGYSTKFITYCEICGKPKLIRIKGRI
jgi:hypothetical protein